MASPSPLRPTDDDARALARRLMAEARHAALGVIHPDTGAPFVSRIAFGLADGAPLTLVSDLALHSRAMQANPAVSVLIGEPGGRGDPLTHPRLTVQAMARFIPRDSGDHARLRTLWRRDHPKSALYLDFADFRFVMLSPVSAALNGGFGKAFALTPADLGAADPA
jgi:putative heme iron utilization protein